MTTTLDIFRPPSTEEESGRILADHLPQGRAWGKKNTPNSTMNGLIRGLSSNFKAVQDKTFELVEEFDINNSVNLLEEYEISVGIPDECVVTSSTISERQQRVIQRLKKTPIVTISELQEYLQAFFESNTITVSNVSPSQTFEFTFEFQFSNNINEKFLLTISITDSTIEDVELLTCLSRNVVPGNVAIKIKEV